MDIEKIHEEFQKLQNGRGHVVQQEWEVLEVAGKDREKFLHNLLSQDLEKQNVGERRWATLLNSKGRVIGFFEVWKLAAKYLLIVHDANKEAVFKTLDLYLITEEVSFRWLEDLELVTSFVPSKEKLLEGYLYQTNQIVEENVLRCSTDDYFIPSVQLLLKPDQQKFLSQSTEISNDLYDSIRIQSLVPVPGQDFDDPIPIEVPFMHRAISFTKGCYVGQETIARLHARGLNVSRKLLPFACDLETEIASQNPVIFDQTEVGKVTSIACSILDKRKIGLAWIHRNAFGKFVTVNNQAIRVGGVSDDGQFEITGAYEVKDEQ